MVYNLHDLRGEAQIFRKDGRHWRILDVDINVCPADIEGSIRNNKDKRLRSCYGVFVALCLSHKLQRYFLLGWTIVCHAQEH